MSPHRATARAGSIDAAASHEGRGTAAHRAARQARSGRFVEPLEARVLRSVDDPKPTDGNEYLFLAASADDGATAQLTPRAVPAAHRRPTAPLRGGDGDDFTFFDGTGWHQMAGASDGAVRPIFVDGVSMWADTENPHADRSAAHEANSRNLARRAMANGGSLVIDIEHWPVDIRQHGTAAVDQTMARFAQLIGWLRDEEPQLVLGMYGMFPIADVYASTALGIESIAAAQPGGWWENALPTFIGGFAAWQAANEYLRPLMDRVDVIYPSLYDRVDNREHWNGFAVMLIDESRRYGKPVVPFLFSRYHPSVGANGNRPMSMERWREQIDLVRAHADGVVAWYDVGYSVSEDWVQTFTDIAKDDRDDDDDNE